MSPVKKPAKQVAVRDVISSTEFSITAHLQIEGNEFWMKTGATARVEPGDSAEEAWQRVRDFSVNRLIAGVHQLEDDLKDMG